MTEKQPQTCYVLVDTPDWDEEFALYKVYSSNYVIPALNELPDRYIFTKEELESLKIEWQREAAKSAFSAGWNKCLSCPVTWRESQNEKYLNNNYPATTKA